MAKKKQESRGGEIMLAALATVAASAGAYFLYGSKDAQKNRKMVKGWALKAKGEVMEKIEMLKGELTEENYNKIVDTVLLKYQNVKTSTQDEVLELGGELKSHWKNIKKHLVVAPQNKKAKKTVKK